MRRLVVLGGGYGGLTVVRELLGSELPDDLGIMLIDRQPFQGLKTDYYALAAGTASEEDIRVLFPTDYRLEIKYGEVASIDTDEQCVHLADEQQITYDWLVLALGCTDHYRGIAGAQQYTNSIQSFPQTRSTYKQINNVRPYGQITIIGGGLSGVEMAAELRESRKDLNICILERGTSLLSGQPLKLQKYAHKWFMKHDVEIRTGIQVNALDACTVYNGKEHMATDETVWTAGIQPSIVVRQLQFPKDKYGRLIVDAYFRIPSAPNLFVVGDCASLPFPPSAQLAHLQGTQVSTILHALWKQQIPKLKPIKIRGTFGSLGQKAGFGTFGSIHMTGRIPRWIKSGILLFSKHQLR